MRRGLPIALGVVLLLLGAVWTAQGFGYLKGSFMTGQQLWAVIGLLCVGGGITLLFTALRK